MKDKAKILQLELKNTISQEEDKVRKQIQIDLHDFLLEIMSNVFSTNEKPLDTFSKAFHYLNEAEQKAFSINNLMESIKNGKDMKSTIKRYNEIGLTNYYIEEEEITREEKEENKSSQGSGKFLLKIKKILRNIGLILINIIEEAVKELADKIKISIGFSGFFPTIAFIVDPDKTISAKILIESILDIDSNENQ